MATYNNPAVIALVPGWRRGKTSPILNFHCNIPKTTREMQRESFTLLGLYLLLAATPRRCGVTVCGQQIIVSLLCLVCFHATFR